MKMSTARDGKNGAWIIIDG